MKSIYYILIIINVELENNVNYLELVKIFIDIIVIFIEKKLYYVIVKFQ